MGIFARTVNHDREAANLEQRPVIANDLDISYPEDKKKLDRLLTTNYHGPTFSMEPVCDCGHLKGGDKRGRICPECKTEVLPHTEKKIQSEIWLEVPEGVKAFINPYVYSVLSDAFGVDSGGVDVIRWLVDKTYNGKFENSTVVQALKERGIRRGLNYFCENFDFIIDTLLDNNVMRRNNDRNEIPAFLEVAKDDIFCRYLPIPNKITFVTESSAVGKYAEMEQIGSAIDAVNAILSLKTRIGEPSPAVKENVAVKVILNLASFYRAHIDKTHSGKHGLWRKVIFGTRMPFSGRAVITSLTERHDYDELHQPWGLAIAMWKFHIENKLYKRGFTPNEAKRFIEESVKKVTPLMEEIFDELINESPYQTHSGKKGLPVIFNRNPTLEIGSIQQFYITHIKRDLNDPSISISVLVLKPLNGEERLTA